MFGSKKNKSKKQKKDHAQQRAPQNTQQATVQQSFHAARVIPTVAIASGKGGVGKSTVTHHLAFALKKLGKRVGIIDADIYGPTQTKMFGGTSTKATINPNSGKMNPIEIKGIQYISVSSMIGSNSPSVWRAPIATKMVTQFLTQTHWSNVDILLIDLPPGTGDVQITLSQRIKLSGAVIVTTPQEVALDIAHKGLEMFSKVKVPILGVIENMSGYSCPHCGEHSAIFKEDGASVLANYGNTEILAKIPLDSALVHAGDQGCNLIEEAPESPVSAAYNQIANKLLKNLSEQQQSDKPIDIKIKPEALMITWADISRIYNAYQLRLNCTCALCQNEFTGESKIDPEQISSDVKIKSMGEVGNYGLKLNFTDGHNTGIYTFEKLKTINPQKLAH